MINLSEIMVMVLGVRVLESSDRCGNCNQPVMSLTFRFCPYCGQPYQTTSKE
ncbi:MAG: hypothetical protein F6K23_37845 [Okeania sp. SIO2C9]|uniref:hypothetical protein n=1 Tax=Okeania sp. SIO2C9 TaxID=2607791 RepID=UPI0013C049E5|nr:hypothetical protein [Okeania sp. SIO2C9]NEQ78252.1 hypothetical protein [Okeania sp. SIO2C9]